MFTFMWRFVRLAIGMCAILAVIGFSSSALIPVGSKHPPASSASLNLVLVNSTDGLAHYGQSVTFHVSTTATTEPNVSVSCYQGGTLVYSAESGFYPSYPWPGTQIFPLSSPSWTGGAASCTASLYYFAGRKTVTLTTLDFQVYA